MRQLNIKTVSIITLSGLLLTAMAAELKSYELPVHSRITNTGIRGQVFDL